MADLSQLYKTAPLTAAFFTGQQQNTDQETDRLNQNRLQQLIQSLQQQTQQNTAMAPLLQQHQDLQNQGLSAQLPGQVANSQSLQQKAALGAATLPGDISAVNAGNMQKTGASNIASSDQITGALTKAAALLDNEPAVTRPAKLAQILQSQGIPLDNPGVQTMLKVPGEQLPDVLRKAGDTLVQHSGSYMQGVDKANIEANAHVRGAELTSGATVQAANIAANSRENVAQIKADIQDKIHSAVTAKNFQQASLQSKALADAETDPAKKARYIQDAVLYAKQDLAHQQAAGTGAGKIDPTALGDLPQVKTVNPMADALGDQGGSDGLIAPNSGGIPEAAKKAWGSYDPGKYDYRVGPNGALQRKPKGN